VQLTVVYIDDEPDMGQMFEDHFARGGIAVHCFTDPKTGLEAIPKLRPDIVLLDYRLPGKTAHQLLAHIDESIPVALISGDLDVPLGPRFVRAFAKPLDLAAMRAFLASFARP